MTKTIRIEQIARVEGHGGIQVELDYGHVRVVRFDIFEGSRFIETLAGGHGFDEVPAIVSRICAICSVSHSLASIRAIENAFGVAVTPQTELLRDLMHRGEMIASHALHLFLLAAPDYLNQPSAVALASVRPEFVNLGLRLKKLGNRIQEAIGGRAIHPVNAVPGGFAALPEIDELIALRRDLREALADCESMIDAFAGFIAPDCCRSKTVFTALRDGSIIVRLNGKEETIAPADYRTLTNERAELFSTAKHSLYHGHPFMMGALARLTVHQKQLTSRAEWAMNKLDLRLPSENPLDNNKAQAIELLLDVEQAQRIVQRILLQDGLKPERPVPVTPCASIGTAVMEAPRGLLIHSYEFDEQGLVRSADVVTPTEMIAASIERHLRATAEQNCDDGEAALARRLELVARAYDPCISCSVHVIEKRNGV